MDDCRYSSVTRGLALTRPLMHLAELIPYCMQCSDRLGSLMPTGVARFRITTSSAAFPRGGVKGIKEWAWSELTGWRNG